MSNVCCKEFKGWFKSFTKIERVLAVLEAILLVLFVVLLILFILHLIVCAYPTIGTESILNVTVTSTFPSKDKDSVMTVRPLPLLTVSGKHPAPTNSESVQIIHGKSSTSGGNAKSTSDKMCSWTPSAKTAAVTHYYEGGNKQVSVSKTDSRTRTASTSRHTSSKTTTEDPFESETGDTTPGYVEEIVQSDKSDGEEAEDEYKSFVVALVKPKPPREVIFGCILTVVSERWTLTAASCIEAIEETDSIDSFVIMERYGTSDRGPSRSIEDVRIHPLYGGRNRSYDLAAIKSAERLATHSGGGVELASALHAALSTVGDRFLVLGYGPLRSAGAERRLRRAGVVRVGARMCGGGAALRHLAAEGRAGAAVGCGGAGAEALCCGPLFARGQACRYCAGTPLLRGRRLHGVMADDARCGITCEPQLYVSVADLADWINYVMLL